MGIELVKQVAATCGHLKGNEYKCLTYMAATALDRPNDKGQPAHLYFGGWEALAIALGYSDPDGRYETVRRALRGLVADGKLERLEDHARAGVRQTFRLTLDLSSPAETAGLQPLQSVGARTPQNSGAEPPRNSVSSPAETAGPRKHQGLDEALSQGINPQDPAPSHLGRRSA